ncbi:MAG: hypothetical protein ACK5MP_06485 [Nostocoides sp.]
MSEQEPVGVVFPEVDGRRSTSATGRAIVADALRGVDPVGAAAVERETNWRSGYLVPFRRLVEAGLASPESARHIAEDGLTSLTARMRYRDADGSQLSLAEVAGTPAANPLETETLHGGGQREEHLSLPYQGRRLVGGDILDVLETWVGDGVVEPSFAAAIGDVVDHPEWLDLRGRTIGVIGAGSEMGPYRSLLRWGATVAAVDLPRRGLWDRVLTDAASSAGTLLVPTRSGTGPLTTHAGADVTSEVSAVAAWLTDLPGDLVLGNYVYADGAANVRVATAVDTITEAVRTNRDGEVTLAFLATPTDIFAVPGEAVRASAAAYAHRRTSKVLRGPLRTMSGGRLLKRNYGVGEDPGLNDSVVLQQGPNYLLAKRLQRWRATTARAQGAQVSFHVAPPTRTRSVVKNRALAAAYGGAHRFGVTVFEPGTANTLMAALLVRDLAAGVPAHEHPWQDEAYAAAHGGLWRCAYDPRSALGLAAILGLGSAR